MAGDVYCVDTSALIDVRRHYPSLTFGVWPAVEQLIAEGRLFAPIQVFDELQQFDDELRPWSRTNRAMFRSNTVEVARAVADLQGQIGALGDIAKLPEPADPWVVGWAIVENDRLGRELFSARCVVVAHEGRRKPGGIHKIPDACDHVKVACMRILDMFAAEGWRFDLVSSRRG